jgi:hypothetical protein
MINTSESYCNASSVDSHYANVRISLPQLFSLVEALLNLASRSKDDEDRAKLNELSCKLWRQFKVEYKIVSNI